MKAPANAKSTNNTESRPNFLTDGTWEILKVRKVNDLSYSFDFKIHGITIYGMWVKWWEAGKKWFVALPTRAGRDGKYYNHVYMPLSDHDQDEIIKAVEAMAA